MCFQETALREVAASFGVCLAYLEKTDCRPVVSSLAHPGVTFVHSLWKVIVWQYIQMWSSHLQWHIFLSSADTLISTSQGVPARIGKSHSSSLLDDPDDEEYEYMNKQIRTNISLRHNSLRTKTNKKRTSSTSSHTTAYSGDTTPSMELRRSQTMSSYNSDVDDDDIKYEYMDIRSIDKDDSPPAHAPPLPPLLAKAAVDRQADEVEEEETDGYVEDSNYHYTNRQPKLRQALQQMKPVKVQGRGKGQLYEYEDMDSIVTARPEDAAVYQNIQRVGEGAAGQSPPQRSSIDAYVSVQAGVGLGEPAAAERSFDNLEYWHSRMFLNPNAVQTWRTFTASQTPLWDAFMKEKSCSLWHNFTCQPRVDFFSF